VLCGYGTLANTQAGVPSSRAADSVARRIIDDIYPRLRRE
jgi:hypothetical protein